MQTDVTNVKEEEKAIRERYARRDAAGKRDLWRWTHLDGIYVDYRKRVAWSRALASSAMDDLASLDILDVGCGEGSWLRMLLEWGALAERLHGLDLLQDRIATARERSHPEMDFRCDSAWPLSYEDNSMDLVAASTVFSSILDPESRQTLAVEIERVTKPGGRIMVYDFAVSHPRNPDTIGIGTREIRKLFARTRLVRTYRVTLAPPLTRRFPSSCLWVAHALEALFPLLRTHRLFVLEKPAVTSGTSSLTLPPLVGKDSIPPYPLSWDL